jgi:hypothetical protein
LSPHHHTALAPPTPQDKADAMVAHLASLAEQRLIVSFAPKTPFYSVLKRIGELFPGPSKVCWCDHVVGYRPCRSCKLARTWSAPASLASPLSRVQRINHAVPLCCYYYCCCQATRAYLHAEADVEAALSRAGFTVVKREMTATKFYFSRLLEAVKA